MKQNPESRSAEPQIIYHGDYGFMGRGHRRFKGIIPDPNPNTGLGEKVISTFEATEAITEPITLDIRDSVSAHGELRSMHLRNNIRTTFNILVGSSALIGGGQLCIKGAEGNNWPLAIAGILTIFWGTLYSHSALRDRSLRRALINFADTRIRYWHFVYHRRIKEELSAPEDRIFIT